MESSTKILRRLLDERGIEWWHDDDLSPDHTEWMTDEAAYTSLGMDGDTLAIQTIRKMTPEQAVEATVGRGTCHIETVSADARDWPDNQRCDACGGTICMVLPEAPRYCPNCGRRIVE